GTAEVERAFDLVRCQRVLDVDGAGTVAHLERPDLLGDVVEVDVHRDVEHPYPCADLAGQYGDPALPGHERPQHGRGDLPWIGRHVRPRTGDAVIACEHHHAHVVHGRRRYGAVCGTQPRGELLKPAECPDRFDQPVESPTCLTFDPRIG